MDTYEYETCDCSTDAIGNYGFDSWLTAMDDPNSAPADPFDWSMSGPLGVGLGSPDSSMLPTSVLGPVDSDGDGIPDAVDSRTMVNDTADVDFDLVPDADDNDPLDPLVG